MGSSIELKASDNFVVRRRPAVNSEDSGDEDMITTQYLRMDSTTCAPSNSSTSFSFVPRQNANGNNKEAPSSGSSVVNSSLVPTISVTPYSPVSTTAAATAAGKHYIMLEENLRQLHDIVDSVQQMKDDNTAVLYANSRSLYSNEPAVNMRLSCSCPSLNEQDSDSDLQTSFNSSPSYRDASTSLSTSHFSGPSRRQRASCDWAGGGAAVLNALSDEALRRKSWSALEDLSDQKWLPSEHRRHKKQRSISVSSLESDYVEDPFTDSTANLLGAIDSALTAMDRRRKSAAAATSTLQKSVSTPSILTLKDNTSAKEVVPKVDHNVTALIAQHPSGTESETEEEILASLLETGASPSINRSSLLSYIQDGSYANRQEKRQKRGSLFFRKKKDLPGKLAAAKKNVQVSFPVNYSGLPNDHVSQFQFQFQNALAYSDETPLVPLDFLNECPITSNDLDTDPFLGLQDDEPETWSLTVNKELMKKLKEKEIKRQEHIYELILTEKHHCLTLRVMQKIFVDGLQKYFNLGINLNRMFPRLADLTDIHLRFLYLLRERQREAPVVENIGDVLLELFSGESAEKLKSAYGEFCSRHREAVNIYKCYLQHDSKFAMFVKHCQNNPLLKKKGIPECILFVTQRLTKYPLLIEPLIKTSKENREESDRLAKSMSLVKEILVKVDSKVEEKEKEEKKLEIYNKIDPKSFTYYKGKKFRKSSILSNNRKLQYEGVAMLMQGRTKMQMVHVIVLSDIIFFLTENNNKFTFVTPYGKEGVISLQKLLVREKAGSDTRGLYLISSHLPNPEMYELKIHKPKEKQVWIRSIRDIIRNCSIEENDVNAPNFACSSDERQNVDEQQQHVYLHQIIEGLRQKDIEQAITLEEKISLQMKLLAADGINLSSMEAPAYGRLLSKQTDRQTMHEEVVYVLQRVQELTSSFYNTESSLSRSASSVGERQSVAYISPILPKRAETFGGFDNANKEQPVVARGAVGGRKLSQQLPRKPTENQSSASTSEPLKKLSLASFLEEQQISWKNVLNMMGANFNTTANTGGGGGSTSAIATAADTNSTSTLQQGKPLTTSTQQLPLLLQVDKDVQPIILELTSHMYTLATVIMKQTTFIEELQGRLKTGKDESEQSSSSEIGSCPAGAGGAKKEKKLLYNHSQQLEELRNLQDRLSQEKERWHQEKETDEKDLEEKRQQLLRLQEQIRNEQNDVTLQREQLYRKLELLSSQGMLINSDVTSSPPSMISTSPIPPPDQPPSPSDMSRRRSDSMRWKQQMLLPGKTSSSTLPLNLISATNQQKVSSNVQIKQKLPLKLASKLAASNSAAAIASSSSPSSSSGPSSSVASPVQQIIPLKLQQSVGGGSNNECKYPTGYEKLQSSTDAPPTPCSSSSSSVPSPSHSRTGSSPAMMQYTEGAIADAKESSSKAERTNTYPKISDRYRVQSPPNSSNGKKANSATEEEVIFF